VEMFFEDVPKDTSIISIFEFQKLKNTHAQRDRSITSFNFIGSNLVNFDFFTHLKIFINLRVYFSF